MQYVRQVDFDAFPKDEFRSQFLADRSTGLDSCVCIFTRVPPGRGTRIGRHTHQGDQLYYVVQGHMHANIGGQIQEADPGTLVYLPAGVPHWNWNEGSVDEMHFEFIVPGPSAGEELATAVPDNHSGRAVPAVPLIRKADESQFNLDEFSWVTLADRASGVDTVSLGLFRVPPAGHAPRLHVHRFDQIYFVLRGTMSLRIGFDEYEAPANSLVILPAGMPHTNWNAGSEVVYFLNCRTPEPASDSAEPWDIAVQFGGSAE
jgi:mannose-6-phosphate isomerase-like protein (cupin superfamily)